MIVPGTRIQSSSQHVPRLCASRSVYRARRWTRTARLVPGRIDILAPKQFGNPCFQAGVVARINRTGHSARILALAQLRRNLEGLNVPRKATISSTIPTISVVGDDLFYNDILTVLIISQERFGVWRNISIRESARGYLHAHVLGFSSFPWNILATLNILQICGVQNQTSFQKFTRSNTHVLPRFLSFVTLNVHFLKETFVTSSYLTICPLIRVFGYPTLYWDLFTAFRIPDHVGSTWLLPPGRRWGMAVSLLHPGAFRIFAVTFWFRCSLPWFLPGLTRRRTASVLFCPQNKLICLVDFRWLDLHQRDVWRCSWSRGECRITSAILLVLTSAMRRWQRTLGR